MTPAPIARFMAHRMVQNRDWAGRTLRLLDPAAGSGVLASALVEALVSLPARPAHIELLMCELDPSMRPLLDTSSSELESLCRQHGVGLDCRVQGGDFLLSDLARSGEATVDAVIANPPYFKLSGTDTRAKVYARAVHGQPNIYALFMASCASLLRAAGAYCLITPRSWTNGAYFSALRVFLLERLSVDSLHLFDSREAHFRADAVLQEALITWATAGRSHGSIVVSNSAGAGDIDEAKCQRWDAGQILSPPPERVVSIPAAHEAGGLGGLRLRLHDLGLKVSTGPVVGFRAAAHLRARGGSSTAPMLWMPHVRTMCVEWPRQHRAEYIAVNDASAWMLLPNRPMVLMRRFSPKEDRRRVTAAPYVGQLPGDWIGVENHLNVIHPMVGQLSPDAACGLAAYLNSESVDNHLRRVLGSTQVNARELRTLPVPDLLTLEALGRARTSTGSLDDAVAALCGLERPTTSARHA